MNGKKLIIAGAVTIFALAALLIASGIYILIVFDPLAFFSDGTLDNTGAAGLVIIVVLGPLALFLKIAMFSWLGAGIIFAFTGIKFVYRLAKKELFRLRGPIHLYNSLSILISLLALLILFVEVDMLFESEDATLSIPLVIMVLTTMLTAILGITSTVLNSKILKII